MHFVFWSNYCVKPIYFILRYIKGKNYKFFGAVKMEYKTFVYSFTLISFLRSVIVMFFLLLFFPSTDMRTNAVINYPIENQIMYSLYTVTKVSAPVMGVFSTSISTNALHFFRSFVFFFGAFDWNIIHVKVRLIIFFVCLVIMSFFFLLFP